MKTHVDGISDFFQSVETNHLLEVVEQRVARSRVREVCDRRSARPGNNRCEEDTNEYGTTNAVHHKQQGEDTA